MINLIFLMRNAIISPIYVKQIKYKCQIIYGRIYINFFYREKLFFVFYPSLSLFSMLIIMTEKRMEMKKKSILYRNLLVVSEAGRLCVPRVLFFFHFIIFIINIFSYFILFCSWIYLSKTVAKCIRQ
jgi:hypothetical protein